MGHSVINRINNPVHFDYLDLAVNQKWNGDVIQSRFRDPVVSNKSE